MIPRRNPGDIYKVIPIFVKGSGFYQSINSYDLFIGKSSAIEATIYKARQYILYISVTILLTPRLQL